MRHALRSNALLGAVFVLPAVVVLGATIVYPLTRIVLYSVRDAGTGFDTQGSKFVWLDNYRTVLASESFAQGFKASAVVVVISVVLTVSLAMVMARLLNESFRGRGLARSLLILPWALPTFVAAFTWRWMVDYTYGAFNHILVATHLTDTPILFLGKDYAIVTASVVYTWKGLPLATIILLAGLQTVPQELRDAARVDGASAWREWLHVELPALRFMIQITVILLLIWNFNVFELMWLLTQGGPGDATAVLPIHVYLQAFRAFDLGQASALGVIMLMILLTTASLILWLWPTEEADI